MAEHYRFHPNRVEALVGQFEEIALLARNIAEEFLDEVAPTVTWPGTGSEFAEKAKPQELTERETTKGTLLAVRDAIVGVTEATRAQIRMVNATRNQHLESIERTTSTLGTHGFGDGGGTGGYGRR